MSKSDRLKYQLLTKYDPEVRPYGLTEVWTQLKIAHVDYEAETSTLSTRASLKMHWTDAKLRWNPEEYEDRNRLRLADKKQYARICVCRTIINFLLDLCF